MTKWPQSRQMKKIKTFNNQRIYKHTDPQKTYEPESHDFTYVLKVLKTDPDLKIFIQTLQSRGIDLIMLKRYTRKK